MRLPIPVVFASVYAGAVLAVPHADWNPAPPCHACAGWLQCNHSPRNDYPIHNSCNATERRMIRRGLQDAMTLAARARDHVLWYGKDSALYRKYFGDGPTSEVIGNLERVVSGKKWKTLFRCDDPDGNCKHFPKYGGHWRGENATDETVICALSYHTRLYLDYFCTRGYTVSGSPRNTYWGTDMLHRLFHMPAIGESYVDHFASSYEDVMHLAKYNSTYATRDSNTLQYFAADVYGHEVAVPHFGCPGKWEEEKSTTTTMPPTTQPTQDTPTPTVPQPPAPTVHVPPNCHTHEGGELHCL
ncbi:hypothetical protein RJZ56_003225 [Blastomyces dermatitidis]|uniref:CHA1 n=2 Tax=Ajellomyces dermatitidis TaxID=5039 RepID=F2TAV7_AJEDA|nr:CHA1 protein [Blastomyces dermatitidis ER-3]EEQ91485.1 CHA1 protein [Blastomyces dermatitidis ER-3]EGE80370.1 CHA1 [Blastomyces dermatitidis ATCC 18188]EQL32488.1 hypothetical protein BDFG_05357 [Blastomyces dermatitidis ATCC 26199]